MVKVYQSSTPLGIDDESYDAWCRALVSSNEPFPDELWNQVTQLLRSAISAEPADEKVQAGLFNQSFAMANILSSLKVSSRALMAAILYPFVDAGLIQLDLVKSKCSVGIANQLKGVATMDAIRSLQANFKGQSDEQQIDNLRRMLLAMVDDVRVVLIKLAERLYLLRNVSTLPLEEHFALANEISEVYAPLANRLGVGQIKWEMEDLTFRVLHRDEYIEIAKSLDEKRVARETYVQTILDVLNSSLQSHRIKGQLEGRAKHIYSIWKKMQRKQVGFEEIYDVRAVRVLVPEIQDCYTVLGVVHGLWKHIPKEFDDYIATPKENGYRSLHTAVVGPEGKTLEIQIRTFQMHQESELGVAAHWKYKEGKATTADGYEAKIAWLRQLLDWQDEVTESSEIVNEFKNQVLEERIYVFTPAGKLIDLPATSTALDFAYRVHTDVGHRCRGAKVNGRIVALTQPLETGQKVEILTAKTGGPSRDWLNDHRGYLKSSRARSKVHQWFRHQDKEKNAAAGKLMLDKEIQKQNYKSVDLRELAKHFNYNREEELYAGIGAGDKGIHQISNAIRTLLDSKKEPINRETVIRNKPKIQKRSASSDILVEGVGNLLTRMAGCCKPVPGDDIRGYVTQSRGIMIHRSDCNYLLSSQKNSPEKILQVEWTDAVNENYLIDLLIKAYDRKGLLGDVTSLMADEKVSVTALKTHVNKQRLMVGINIQIEVPSLSAVSRVMSRVEQLPTIVSVQRK